MKANPPFFRRTKRSEKDDYYRGSCKERNKKYYGWSVVEQNKYIIEATIALELDQSFGTIY